MAAIEAWRKEVGLEKICLGMFPLSDNSLYSVDGMNKISFLQLVTVLAVICPPHTL